MIINYYFNVGDDLYKQMKGVSMGCYFSKEISDLVLLYAEYKFYQTYKEMSLVIFRRYADDGFMFFSTKNLVLILSELRRLSTFYPKNLVINIKLNVVCCQYLDLILSLNDISDSEGIIHYKTFFKKFHKFSYIEPSSNHPNHVFKGLIRTECARYLRNSLTKGDYDHSVDLLCMRLKKRGYKINFIRMNIIDYDKGRLQFTKNGVKATLERKIIAYTMLFNKTINLVESVENILRKASRGLYSKSRLVISKSVLPKLRNILSTRKILHNKLRLL